MTEVIGVRFKEVGKIYYFDPSSTPLNVGDYVIVETARGIECGQVATANRFVDDSQIIHPLKKMVRKATDADLEKLKENKKKEK